MLGLKKTRKRRVHDQIVLFIFTSLFLSCDREEQKCGREVFIERPTDVTSEEDIFVFFSTSFTASVGLMYIYIYIFPEGKPHPTRTPRAGSCANYPESRLGHRVAASSSVRKALVKAKLELNPDKHLANLAPCMRHPYHMNFGRSGPYSCFWREIW